VNITKETEKFVKFVRKNSTDKCVEFHLSIENDGCTYTTVEFKPSYPEGIPDAMQGTRRNLAGDLIDVI